jgi:alpha-tubulin suppressor-like RCC1 family protein
MLSNSSEDAPRPANYILGDYSNAVFFGYPIDETVSTNDTIIYINPEYRGIEYTVNIDIYMSNYENTAITLSLVINEESIKPIRLYNYAELIYPDLSNNVISITDLRSLYDYPFSNYLQFKYSNSETGDYSIALTDDDLIVTAALRGQTYTVTLQAFDQLFTYSLDSSYSEYNLDQNTTNSNLVNEELQFEFQELPAIKFKDSYNGCNYYEFNILEHSGDSYYIFTQNDLTDHIFVKSIEECNIILNVKESSTFKSYVLNDTSNELTIEFDFNYYALCNIDFVAYLENYEGLKLETTIRVIMPQLPLALTNDKQYYNLIGDEYLNPITHKIEFPNVFKNTQDDEDLSINIINIQGDNASSFNYDGNMIYSYIRPSTTFYKPNNDITPQDLTLSDSIEFTNFNNNCNEVGPYYQIDGNKFNVIYAFKHNDTGYNIKFEDKFNNYNLEVLVVSGGEGGTSGTEIPGSGGSGGKVIYSNIMIDSSKTYNIVVGDGGDSDTAGGNSHFDNIIAIGGASENPTIYYVNNSWIQTGLDFKIDGVGYSNVEEKIFSNLGCNLSSFMLSIGAGSTTEDPSLGKYEENGSNFYDIYKNTSIGDYSNSKIYFGDVGNFGFGPTKTTVLLRNAYSFGYGGNGQLGHENINTYNLPTPIDALADSNIVAISSAGYGHSLFLDNVGKVYSCGDNTFGQLGRTGISISSRSIPLQITENIGTSNIIAISAGAHSLFLDNFGKVYGCGDNSSGELGHGNTKNDYDLPTLIDALADSNIVAISAGSMFSLFLDAYGKVYSCGHNFYGQLGRTIDDNTLPIQITEYIGTSNIVAISAGVEHSLFLDEYGRVYSCGRPRYRLGRQKSETIPEDYTLPLQITENIGTSNIIAISAGYFHSLFLDEYGRVYSCGDNDNGQLGLGNSYDCNFPTLIDALADSNIVAISAGIYGSLFLDEYGKVYSCGYNYHGQLGHTNINTCNFPTPIDALADSNIVAISAGFINSFFISADAITEIKTQLPSTSLGGGGDAVADSSSPGKSLSGGGGSGGAIGNYPGGRGGSGLVLLKYNTKLTYYQDEYYCNVAQGYQELIVSAENIIEQTRDTLRFVRLGYTTLTVPNLINDKVSNIYVSEEELSYDVGRPFSIEYNPLYEYLGIVDCNLIITNTNNSTIYDTIINLGDNIYNIFRINESTV